MLPASGSATPSRAAWPSAIVKRFSYSALPTITPARLTWRRARERLEVLGRADPAGVQEAAADGLGDPARPPRCPGLRACRRDRRSCRRTTRRRGPQARIASAAGSSVVCVQPAVEIEPPRTSTETTIAARRRRGSRRGSRRRGTPRCRRSRARRRRAARRAPPSTVRRPPPYWTGTPVPWTIRRRCSIDARLAVLGAVEVDDVQVARARVDPALRGLERVVVVGRGVLEAALDEPHRAAADDVDRRVEDHAATPTARSCAAARARRARTSRGGTARPSRCRARRSTRTRSPYSPRPTTSSSVRRLGRRASARGRRPRPRRARR